MIDEVALLAPLVSWTMRAGQEMASIEQLAYARWETRGRPMGDDWADWFAAEAEHRAGERGSAAVRTPELRFDFMADLRAIYEQKLALLGVAVDAQDKPGEVLVRYFALSYRVIEPAPRRVVRSRELAARETSLAVDRQQAIACIEALSTSGGDLNPYQSRQLASNPGAPDAQLLDWGITHMHLGLKRDTKRPAMMEGTSALLFVVVRDDALYLIEVLDHHAFADDRVFNIANGNWPELFAHAALHGVVGLERPVSAEERAALRRAKINVPTLASDGSVYGAVQQGMTTAGTPVAVMRTDVIPRIKEVKRLERRCLEHREEVLAGFPTEVIEGRDVVELRLIETPDGFAVGAPSPTAPAAT